MDYSCFVAEMISWLELDFVDSGMLLIPQKLVVDEKIISVVAGSLLFNWNASVKYMRIFIAAHCLSVLGWRDWGVWHDFFGQVNYSFSLFLQFRFEDGFFYRYWNDNW